MKMELLINYFTYIISSPIANYFYLGIMFIIDVCSILYVAKYFYKRLNENPLTKKYGTNLIKNKDVSMLKPWNIVLIICVVCLNVVILFKFK